MTTSVVIFFLHRVPNSFSRWRFGSPISIYVWSLFAVANLCLRPMIIFENKFSEIISQSQQFTIATTLLRSPLNCCDRSNLQRKVCVNEGGLPPLSLLKPSIPTLYAPPAPTLTYLLGNNIKCRDILISIFLLSLWY